ncbi:PIN domain-containing protein [Luteimonas sp. M1R5S18]|uniref:PIN domain-containing protein n=1 Tax=Luteimonas rhizosphaericola TaxID=3042024 RepID=A0ABT6JF06_9GAMM|nr:PIN domain-containing protein [Luteimonas rhizosphaericola]MDH5829270.1 PIN domain-containing protein [Luteimonas rhizosphaericola]
MSLDIFLIDFENVQPTGVGRLVPGACRIMLFLGQSQNKVSVELTRALQPFGTDVDYVSISGNGPNAVDFHIAFYIGHLAQKHPGANFNIVSGDTGFDPLVRHLTTTLKIACRRIKALPAQAAGKVAAAVPAAPEVTAVAGRQGTASASVPAAAAASSVHAAGGNVVALKLPPVSPVPQAPVPASSALVVAPAAPASAKRSTNVEVTVLPESESAPQPKPKPKPTPKPVAADVATFTDQVVERLKGLKHAKPATLKTLTSSLTAWATPAPGARVVPQVIASLKDRKLISVEGTKVSYRLK